MQRPSSGAPSLVTLRRALACCSFVKRAMHGTRMMSPAEVREQYGRELVNLRNESRFVFLNTLFSISEAVLYMQVWLGLLGSRKLSGVWLAGKG